MLGKRGLPAAFGDMPDHDSAPSTETQLRSHSISQQQSTPQSSRTFPLPSIPGQWDTIYVPGSPSELRAIKAAGNVFTTSLRFIPIVDNITSLLYATCRVFNKYTRRQVIEAVSVTHANGARKKVLLDAGALDEPQTPTPSVRTRALHARRAEQNRSTNKENAFYRYTNANNVLATNVENYRSADMEDVRPTAIEEVRPIKNESLSIHPTDMEDVCLTKKENILISPADVAGVRLSKEEDLRSTDEDNAHPTHGESVHLESWQNPIAFMARPSHLTTEPTYYPPMYSPTKLNWTAAMTPSLSPSASNPYSDNSHTPSHAPQSSAIDTGLSPESIDLSLLDCFQSTPRHDTTQSSPSTPRHDTSQSSPPSPYDEEPIRITIDTPKVQKDIWPTSDRFGLSRSKTDSHHVPTTDSTTNTPKATLRSRLSLNSPRPTKNMLLHQRIQAICSPPADHTDRKAKKGISKKLQKAILDPADRKAELKKAARETDEIDEVDMVLELAKLQAQQLATDKRIDDLVGPDHDRYGLKRLGDASDFLSFSEDKPVRHYDNDLSFLPDAPEEQAKKTVRFRRSGRAKEFFKDDAACDLLDSSLEYINTSPYKNVLEPEGVADESALSVEVIEDFEEEYQKSLPSEGEESPRSSSPFDEGTSTMPTIPQPTIRPLIAKLTQEEEARLAEAVRKTKGGMDQVQLVENALSTHDFKTLLPILFQGSPSAWLNDNIVNEYLSLLVEHEKRMAGYQHIKDGAPPLVHAFPSQWWTTISKEPKNVSRWAKRVQLNGKKLLDASVVLFPICDGNHWRLLCIKPQKKIIQYVDSMFMKRDDIIKIAKTWLKMELGEHFVESEWTVRNDASTRQLNGSDCGVFTCLNALAILRGETLDRVIADDGMTDARKRMAVSLLGGKPTGELD